MTTKKPKPPADMRRPVLYTAAVGAAGIGIAWATQHQTLGSMVANFPGASSIFGSTNGEVHAAQMDGRIQAAGLLSSRFGPYGWPGQSFDYVIVGGGTAGLTLAKRLAEDGTHSVAVIEAGGFAEIEAGNATEVPMYEFNYWIDNGHVKNPLFDWYQYTTPQPVCPPRCFPRLPKIQGDRETDTIPVGTGQQTYVLYAGQDTGRHNRSELHAVSAVCTARAPQWQTLLLTEPHRQRFQGSVPEMGGSCRGRRLHLGQMAPLF